MNPIRSILVPVDAGASNADRLRYARALATPLEASVTALYAVTPAIVAAPLSMLEGGSVVAMLQEIDDQRLAQTRGVIEQLRTEPGAAVAWHQTPELDPVRSTVQHGYYADLLVLGQRDPSRDDRGVPPDFAEAVLLGCGRPALVLPYVGSLGRHTPVGGTALVAWKPDASAARAITAALPLLRLARRVEIVSWGSQESAFLQGDSDLVKFLRRHGIESQHRHHPDEPADVAELTLSLAADLSADLLVMGCYGHSRARELMLGGASRTILRSMTLPVLMVH